MMSGVSHVLVLWVCMLAVLLVASSVVAQQQPDTSIFPPTDATSENTPNELLLSLRGQKYDVGVSKVMLAMSGAAYCPSSTLKDWKCSFCSQAPDFKPYAIVENAQTHMVVIVGYQPSTDAIIVAFRGTDFVSIINWLQDLDFFAIPAVCGGCKAHGGFVKTYMSVKEQTLAAVRQIRQAFPTSALYITGHSLGGALAYVAALDMAMNENLTATHIVTFGQPRVGDATFTKTFNNVFSNATVWRVTHGQDPVPHLPPRAFGFVHNPTEVYYDVFNTKYRVCDASGEDPKGADQWPIFMSVSDHVTYLGADFVKEWLKCKL